VYNPRTQKIHFITIHVYNPYNLSIALQATTILTQPSHPFPVSPSSSAAVMRRMPVAFAAVRQMAMSRDDASSRVLAILKDFKAIEDPSKVSRRPITQAHDVWELTGGEERRGEEEGAKGTFRLSSSRPPLQQTKKKKQHTQTHPHTWSHRIQIALDANFVQDLGLDSLDAVEIVMAVEDEFGASGNSQGARRRLRPMPDMFRF